MQNIEINAEIVMYESEPVINQMAEMEPTRRNLHAIWHQSRTKAKPENSTIKKDERQQVNNASDISTAALREGDLLSDHQHRYDLTNQSLSVDVHGRQHRDEESLGKDQPIKILGKELQDVLTGTNIQPRYMIETLPGGKSMDDNKEILYEEDLHKQQQENFEEINYSVYLAPLNQIQLQEGKEAKVFTEDEKTAQEEAEIFDEETPYNYNLSKDNQSRCSMQTAGVSDGETELSDNTSMVKSKSEQASENWLPSRTEDLLDANHSHSQHLLQVKMK